MQELTLELTDRCPQGCVHCSSNSGPNKNTILSAPRGHKLIAEAHELGVTRLNLSGGEPLLHRHCPSFIYTANSLGIKTHLYTCGSVRSDKLEPITSSLAHEFAYYDTVLVFNVLSNKPEMHDALTGVEGSMVNTLFSIFECLKAGVRVELNFVPMVGNQYALPSIVDAAKNFGIERVNVLRLVHQGRAVSSEAKRPYREHEFYYQYVKDKAGAGAPFNHLRFGNHRYKKCGIGQKAVVTPEGIVLPCEIFKDRRDDYKGPKTLREALESNPFKEHLSYHKKWLGVRCPLHHEDDRNKAFARYLENDERGE